MKAAQLPRAFQSLGSLRNLNVAAVGLALATITASILGHLFHSSEMGGSMGVLVGLPTLLCAVIWALVLRIRTTVGNGRFRWAWLGSIPLAAINAALACGMLMMFEHVSGPESVVDLVKRFLFGFAAGGTIGAIIWIPALVATLVVFGIPLWRSHALATRGLTGEERGERTIGIVSAAIALVGLVTSLGLRMPIDGAMMTLDIVGRMTFWVLGLGGFAAGALATVFSSLRAGRRKAFVAEVLAGRVEGFRVAEAPEGKVLVRVTSMGQGYRVANFEEPVYEESAESVDEKRLAARP